MYPRLTERFEILLFFRMVISVKKLNEEIV